MLESHSARGEGGGPHGSGPVSLAEMRCALAHPSDLSESCRQRLVELVTRLRRIQGIEDEYTQVELSEHVTSAMDRGVLTV